MPGLDRPILARRPTGAAGAVISLDDYRREPEGEAGISVSPDERPAPPPPAPARRRTVLLLFLGSLVVHGGLIALSNPAPPPLQSAGIPAISVELVIGNNSAAGMARTVAQEEAVEEAKSVRAEATPADHPAEATPAKPEAVKPDEAKPDTVKPLKLAEAKTSLAPEQLREKPPPEAAPLPDEASPQADPVEEVPPADAPPPPVHAVPEAQRPVHERPPEAAKLVHNRRASAHASASRASGVGRGGSVADPNYAGRVAAHLARHKRFPPDARARGEHGSVRVDFSIDGDGRVTGVRMLQSSGYARLDAAAESMVWNASPFPKPPDHKPHHFNVPITYAVR